MSLCHAGEHLLAAAKLSPLNQLAAPLLAGGARLFVAAALPASSSDDGDSPDAPCAQQQRLLAVLAALRHVQAVCTIKSLAAEGGAAEAALPSGWLSWPQFQQQAEQQQRVERQRQAEAAALAAAEADRRQRLQQATKQRQEAAAAAAAAAKNGSAAAAKGGIAMAAAGPAATGPAAAKKQQAGGKQGAAATANCDDASHAEQPAEQPSAPADVGSPTSSLDQLRQQFQSLYQQTVGGSSAVSSLPPRPAAAAGAAGQPTPTAEPEATAAPRQHASAAAAGVAAGDDVAMHVAALRMQVAAEARRLLHAEHARSAAQHGSPAAPSPAAAAADGFSWSSGRPHSSGGGSLGQRLEEELRLLQRHAAVLAGEEGAGAGGGGWAAADHDEASLADLEGASPSLGALYRAASEPYPGLDEQQPGASGSALAAPLSAARRSTQRASAVAEAGVSTSGAAGPAVSDVFQSDWAWSPPASAAAGAAAPDGAEAVVGRSAGDSPQAASSSSVACSVSRPASASASLQHEQQQGGGSGGGSYAAAWRQRAPAAAASGSSKQGSRRPSSLQAELPQQPPGPASALVPAASAGAPAVSRRGASDAAPAVPAVPADLAAADVAELLEELHREQRINGALLQQLHEVQRQLEETAALAAAAAAAQQPPAPGVEDPADFHALLAGAPVA